MDANVINAAADVGTGNGAISGGIMGTLVIVIKELVTVIRGKSYATKSEVRKAIDDKTIEVAAVAKEKAEDLEKKTVDLAEAIKEKSDEQDIKLGLLQHQKECLAEQKADFKDFQSKIVSSFSEMQTVIARMQENNTASFRRIHERIDELVKK